MMVIRNEHIDEEEYAIPCHLAGVYSAGVYADVPYPGQTDDEDTPRRKIQYPSPDRVDDSIRAMVLRAVAETKSED